MSVEYAEGYEAGFDQGFEDGKKEQDYLRIEVENLRKNVKYWYEQWKIAWCKMIDK